MLPSALVDIQLVSCASERRVKLESSAFCKVLHRALFHGWQPERLAPPLPPAAGETEIILPYIEPYLSGNVSETDAKALADSLRRMLASEYLGLSQQLFFVAMAVQSVAEKGAFGLIAGTDRTDPAAQVQEPGPEAPPAG